LGAGGSTISLWKLPAIYDSRRLHEDARGELLHATFLSVVYRE